MSLSKKNQLREQKRKKVWGVEQTHPYKTIFFLGSMALTLAVLFLLFSLWFFDRTIESFESMILPKGLTISILVLLVVSFTASKGSQFLESEKLRSLSFIFRSILLLATIYLVVSLGAWSNLIGDFSALQSSPGMTFLVLIASLHFVQFLIAMGLTLYGYYKLGKNSTDPVKTLVFITNKFELTILEISFFGWYWVTGTGLVIFLAMLYLLN